MDLPLFVPSISWLMWVCKKSLWVNIGLRQWNIRGCEDIFLRRGSRPGSRYSEEDGCVGKGHVGGHRYSYDWFYRRCRAAVRFISKSLVKILRLCNARYSLTPQLIRLQVQLNLIGYSIKSVTVEKEFAYHFLQSLNRFMITNNRTNEPKYII